MRIVLAFAAVFLVAACGGRGAPCTTDLDCGVGLSCKTSDFGGEGSCACLRLEPSLGAGEDCFVDTCEACGAGLVCLRATGTCAPPMSQPAGAACTTTEDCMPGLACAARTCELPGSRGEGEPCAASDNCMAGLRCDLPFDPGHCRAPVEGELCKDNADCPADMTCNGGYAPAECHPPQPAGGYCATPADCASNSCMTGSRVCS